MPRGGGRPSRSFASRARVVIEKHMPEAREPAAHWGSRPNLCWVRWPRAGGGFAYLALRRHLGWVTGEAGPAPEPLGLDALPGGGGGGPPHTIGLRRRLAAPPGEEDRLVAPRGSAGELGR